LKNDDYVFTFNVYHTCEQTTITPSLPNNNVNPICFAEIPCQITIPKFLINNNPGGCIMNYEIYDIDEEDESTLSPTYIETTSEL